MYEYSNCMTKMQKARVMHVHLLYVANTWFGKLYFLLLVMLIALFRTRSNFYSNFSMLTPVKGTLEEFIVQKGHTFLKNKTNQLKKCMKSKNHKKIHRFLDYPILSYVK